MEFWITKEMQNWEFVKPFPKGFILNVGSTVGVLLAERQQSSGPAT